MLRHFSFHSSSSSGASVVAIDNKIEQAMVSWYIILTHIFCLRSILHKSHAYITYVEEHMRRMISSEENVASVSLMNGLHNHLTEQNWEVTQNTDVLLVIFAKCLLLQLKHVALDFLVSLYPLFWRCYIDDGSWIPWCSGNYVAAYGVMCLDVSLIRRLPKCIYGGINVSQVSSLKVVSIWHALLPSSLPW